MPPGTTTKATAPKPGTGKALEVTTLGGGCFWCIEAVFTQLQGVESAISGYTGGEMEDPDYEAVCEGDTGHAEVVQVTFDPSITSYREILEVFFSVHDPTTMNRQGGDVGEQYRSVIYTHSPEQERVAREIIEELTEEEVFASPIVTEVEPISTFYAAEDYHQDYYRNNPGQGYCQAVIAPKLAKFRKKWADKIRA